MPDIDERYIEAGITRDLARKMVFLAGPRQVGKTTFAKGLLKKQGLAGAGRYMNWDDAADRKEAQNDLKVRMDIAAGRHPSATKWKVYVVRQRTGNIVVEVTAPTKQAAETAAKELAKTEKVEWYHDSYKVNDVVEAE